MSTTPDHTPSRRRRRLVLAAAAAAAFAAVPAAVASADGVDRSPAVELPGSQIAATSAAVPLATAALAPGLLALAVVNAGLLVVSRRGSTEKVAA